MWTPTRIAFYITSFLGGTGALLALMGWATYDPVAQTIDLHPVSIPVVVGLVAPVAASALAAVAAAFGWGRK
jgi:multisubunit Na+/H+ antiporter MnhG subunit